MTNGGGSVKTDSQHEIDTENGINIKGYIVKVLL